MIDIETVLRRYRPAAPSSRLRARIVATAQVPLWPWAVAAGLALAATLSVPPLAARAAARVEGAFALDSDARAVDDLSELLGGGEPARRLAAMEIRKVRARMQVEVQP